VLVWRGLAEANGEGGRPAPHRPWTDRRGRCL